MYQVLQEIYQRYGYYQTDLKSISMPGKDGMEKMQVVLANIRQNPPTEMDGEALVFDDFSQGLYGLPKSDVLRFKNDTYRLIIRPSGTEPKMKIYLQVKGEDLLTAQEKMQKAASMLEEILR